MVGAGTDLVGGGHAGGSWKAGTLASAIIPSEWEAIESSADGATLFHTPFESEEFARY